MIITMEKKSTSIFIHVRLELEFGSAGQLGGVKNQLKSLNVGITPQSQSEACKL